MSRGSDSSVLRVALRQRSVQPGRSEQVHLSIPGRNPPLKHHPTRARHGKQMAVLGWLGGVGGQTTVGEVVMGECFEVSQQWRRAMRADWRG
jgi:hypothetical protein